MTSFISTTPAFVEFLNSNEGCDAIANLEATLDAVIHTTEGEQNQAQLAVYPAHLVNEVESDLTFAFHDWNFKRAIRVKLLQDSCQYSHLRLSIGQAALVQFFRPSIVRFARVDDLIIDGAGIVAIYGTSDAIAQAHSKITEILAIHGVEGFSYPLHGGGGSPGTNAPMPAEYAEFPAPAAWSHGIGSSGGGTRPLRSTSSMSLLGDAATAAISGERSRPRRERITFMVQSTDAPRLIGSRGVNKRKIEEETQCLIVLHTENKQNGEFPVEVAGATVASCEAARDHILAFLADPGKEEERRHREKPKMTCFISTTPAFVEFLNSSEGCGVIANLEATMDVVVHTTEGEQNQAQVAVFPAHRVNEVETDLVFGFHEWNFKRAIRIKLLQESCQPSHLQLSIGQAALVQFFRPSIVRFARVDDLIIDGAGIVAIYGTSDAIAQAHSKITEILAFHGAPAAWSHRIGSREGGTHPLRSTSSASLLGGDGATASISGERNRPRRERITFMVQSSDAPRLIESRGINKRKIEEETQCLCTLHTENKQNGEFPVEVTGATIAICEAARDYILAFLADPGKEEERRHREKPKIFLEMSPMKRSTREGNH